MGAAGDAGSRRWLLLDLAGVLLRFEPGRRYERIASVGGLRADDVERRLGEIGIGARLDDGRADGTELSATLGEMLGRPVGVDEAWDLWLAPFTPVTGLLAKLPGLARTWRLGVFTNNARSIVRLFDTTLFEEMFFSSELGATKPDPQAYAAIERALGVDPATIRLVDDGRANVDAARGRGWDAVLFRPGDGLV